MHEGDLPQFDFIADMVASPWSPPQSAKPVLQPLFVSFPYFFQRLKTIQFIGLLAEKASDDFSQEALYKFHWRLRLCISIGRNRPIHTTW